MGQTAHCPSHALQVALTLCALMLCLDVFADSCKHRKAHPLSKSLHYLVKSFRSGNGLPAPSTADSALEYEIVPIHTSIGNSTRPHRDIRDTPSHPHAVDDNPHHSSLSLSQLLRPSPRRCPFFRRPTGPGLRRIPVSTSSPISLRRMPILLKLSLAPPPPRHRSSWSSTVITPLPTPL